MPFHEEVQNKTKTESSTSKQKHIFTFDKNPIDSSCFQVPDSGFKFQDLAIARISLVHSTGTYKNRGKVRYLQCFLLGYGSLSTLQDAPGELQKLLGWILGGRRPHIYIYIYSYTYITGSQGSSRSTTTRDLMGTLMRRAFESKLPQNTQVRCTIPPRIRICAFTPLPPHTSL